MTFIQRKKARARRSAFTLMEVLIALGIFAVAMSAVAAMFPVGILLQRRAMDSVVAQQAGRNTSAMLKGRGLTATFVNSELLTASVANDDFTAQPFAKFSNLDAMFPLADRSHPSSTAVVEDRPIYWVGFVRRTATGPSTDPNDYQLYAFVVHSRNDVNYSRTPTANFVSANWANEDDGDTGGPGPWFVPGVYGVDVTVNATSNGFDFATAGFNADGNGDSLFDYLRIGDQVMDDYGTTYRITNSTADGVFVDGFVVPNAESGNYPAKLWFGVRGDPGHDSPVRRIIVLEGSEVLN